MTRKRLILAALLALALSPASAAPAGWLRQLRFSPDGQHVLAQDDAEITVLTVRPFEILFRIPAENATLAQFTPDSTEIVFVSSVPRVDPQQVVLSANPAHVERWNIVGRTRTALTEVALHSCGTAALSPDGGLVVCDDFQGTLRLIKVTSGETAFEKKKFAQREYLGTLARPCPCSTCKITLVTPDCFEGDPGAAVIGFSPDARFMIAEPVFEGPPIAWDLYQRRTLPLMGELKRLRKSTVQMVSSYALPFAFVAPDLVLLYPMKPQSKEDQRNHVIPTELVSFPLGTVVSKLKLPRSPDLFPAADSNFVLIGRFGPPIDGTADFPPASGPTPLARYAKSTWTAAVEFRSGREAITSNQLALDVLGHYYVAEPIPGEVGLYERGKGIQATVVLRKK